MTTYWHPTDEMETRREIHIGIGDEIIKAGGQEFSSFAQHLNGRLRPGPQEPVFDTLQLNEALNRWGADDFKCGLVAAFWNVLRDTGAEIDGMSHVEPDLPVLDATSVTVRAWIWDD